MFRLFRKRKKILPPSSGVPALAMESRRPMVEEALPVRREPPLTPPPAVDLEEPLLSSPFESPPQTPLATAASTSSVPAVVSTAPFPIPFSEEEEPRPPARLSLLLDAPPSPRRREVLEFLSRAADEIPAEVEKVLRFWLESNT